MVGKLFLRADKRLFGTHGKRPVGGRLPRSGNGRQHQQRETFRPEWCLQWHDAFN
jgi:hypothetical protein